MTKENLENQLVPPWEEFPDYTRYTIGWRMGGGETYFHNWWHFIDFLPSDYESRLKYLKRNRPAPVNWFSIVLKVLDSDRKRDNKNSNSQIARLLELGLIKYDVVFETWLQQQTEIRFPWTFWQLSETPETMVRYKTREFWFFSRQFNKNRNIEIPEIPDAWKEIEYNLISGELGDIDPSKGLLTLAKMFCTGNILTPWQLGFKPDNSHNSYEMDMGYADAYHLWLISAFDDDKLIREICTKTEIPEEWNQWIEKRIQSIFWELN